MLQHKADGIVVSHGRLGSYSELRRYRKLLANMEVFEVRNITYLDSLKKVDERISDNEIIKILFTDLLKICIRKKDYMGLINKTASMFEIPLNDAQMLLYDMSEKENLSGA